MSLATGTVAGDRVLVGDKGHAARLHSKTGCGRAEQGGLLSLHAAEAAWLVATSRMMVERAGRPLTVADVLAIGGASAEADYLAYTDLRDRGLSPVYDGADLVVPRRAAAGPAMLVLARGEREPVRAGDLVAWARRTAVVGVVDEDGVVTHYQLDIAAPTGDCQPAKLKPAEGTPLADRVLVADPGSRAWHDLERLGAPHGEGIVLSFVEAESLRQRGVLRVGDLRATARARQSGFEAGLAVFQDLRTRGVVPKSGFRFGTSLRGYRSDPDKEHAPWLLAVARANDNLPWSDLSRGVRVAHGVRKEFLLAIADPPIHYVRLTWLRP